MKKVFSSANECIHVFAQQKQETGKSSNIFFDHKKCYSYGYHYLLAEFLTDNLVYINDKGYSSTTAKHISIMYSAVSHKDIVSYSMSDKFLLHEMQLLRNKIAKAKKPEIYINQAFRHENNFRIFCEKTKGTNYFPSKEAQKTLKKDFDFFKLAQSPEKFALYQEKERKALILKVKKEKTIFDKYIKLWLQNSPTLPDFLKKNKVVKIGNEDFLRINKENIETTQGIKVPISEAKKLYSAILQGVDIRGYQIGYYTITSLNGVLKAGCHNINVKNMHEIGKQIMSM